MKYLPIQINHEWHLKQDNPYDVPGRNAFPHYKDFEKEAIATAKPIINHIDGKEWYDKSEVEAVWQYYDFQEQIWKTTDTKNITVFENTFEQYSEFYRKTRQAWKYIGENPVETNTDIDIAKVDGYTDGYGDGTDHERTRIIGIIEIYKSLSDQSVNHVISEIITNINNNGK